MKLAIPVTKGKATIEIDTDTDIPEAMYIEALKQGLKVLLNRGTSKIKKETYPNEDELKAAAMAQANVQLEAIKAGTIKVSGATKSAGKVAGAVMTEARRLARGIVKDQIKASGGKISHYEAKDITAAANALLEVRPDIIEDAKANLAKREAAPEGTATIDLKSLIHVSAKKVKAAEDAKTKKKDQLSAKQAGKVQPRAKKQEAQAQTAH
jgi:hypothetical protein